MSADNRRYVNLIHVGPYGCGGIAFSYRDPRQGAPILAADAMLNDGSRPDDHGAMVCGSCGRLLNPPDLQPEGGW